MKESDWTNSLPLDKIITHSKRCEDYLQGETMGESINIDLQKKVSLTRQELHELETKEKTGKERLIEKLILVSRNLRSDSNFGVYADTGQ